MTSVDEMAEMVTLGNLVNMVQLNDQQDVIRWKWTGDGKYTAKSAYQAQLVGLYCTFDCKSIWRAKVEGKHRFFGEEWWSSSLHGQGKKMKQNIAAMLIYTAWNIWRERNRRVFDGSAAMPTRVVALMA
ncbi:hypothetical protein HU200_042153 [Digitaria exilis]|uniref:Uncharacterized protein n=1 Tax=Digitaria exilis TaxID=1010633 RepID=A0A835B325_9POAL|nr:hypothetical protein HU200_042153 [Digitaria exilis]